MELELRTNDNNGTARVIDTFTEQILAEAATLALEHIAEGFEGTIASTGDSAAMTAIVEESVNRLL